MIATDVMHCNHHHYISVIWVHLEKLVDEIAARTHWSGTPPLPLPLLCRPPFLQVNGTAAQQHFMILSSSPWPLSPGSPRTSSEPSRSSSPWSPSPDQPHQGGDERPAAAWVHRPGRLLQQEPLLSCQVSLLARHKFLKVMTFFLHISISFHRDMVFLLGFFVKQIVARWWTTWEAVPLPGSFHWDHSFIYALSIILGALGRPSLCQFLFFFQLPSTPPS